jgi:hypothetical protein
LYDGTKGFIIEKLNYLFQKNNTPTIHDLFRLIKSIKLPALSRTARYQESAINRLGGIISSIGETLDYPCISLEELVKRHVIFEIQKLYSELQVFVVNALLTWLFYYKLYNNNSYYHIVGIDDANLVFDISFERRPDRGLPEISHLLSTIRKSTTEIVINSQIPHQLGASIHSNAFTKIMFSLANGKDIECMARSMGISDSEQLQYCHQIKKREIVVKFSGRWQEPFLANIPEVNILNNVITDGEVRANNARILSSIPLIKPQQEIDVSLEDKKTSEEISDEEKAFLWDIYNRPYVSITERYKTVSLGD